MFREIPADVQASTTFAPAAKDERNDFRHGNALCSDFDERLDIIPQYVHLNVTPGILDARAFSGGLASGFFYQINVAPALPDSNIWSVIASAKCSNAREFKPFAAQLDQDTMLYQRLDDFDFDEWRQSLEPPKRGAPNKPTLECF